MVNLKLADKIKQTRIAIEKNKDVEELKNNLQNIESIMQEFNNDIIAKLFVASEKITSLETLHKKVEQQEKVIFDLQDKIYIQQNQIKTLSESLQTVVKQIDLIENNYSVLETIGGK